MKSSALFCSQECLALSLKGCSLTLSTRTLSHFSWLVVLVRIYFIAFSKAQKRPSEINETEKASGTAMPQAEEEFDDFGDLVVFLFRCNALA